MHHKMIALDLGSDHITLAQHCGETRPAGICRLWRCRVDRYFGSASRECTTFMCTTFASGNWLGHSRCSGFRVAASATRPTALQDVITLPAFPTTSPEHQEFARPHALRTASPRAAPPH